MTVTFSKSSPAIIYFGGGASSDSQVGGYKPVIGLQKDTDGVYYWTLDGVWLTDAQGNKVSAQGVAGADGTPGTPGANGADGQKGEDGKDGADGKTPQLKIENGYWYVSYDGQSWAEVGRATGFDRW